MIKQIIQSLIPHYFTTLIPKTLGLIWLNYFIVYNSQTILAQTLSRQFWMWLLKHPHSHKGTLKPSVFDNKSCPWSVTVIECQSCTINNKSFDYILVSRRSVYRAGTRFYVRGIDTEGQVANFVETEQIVQYEGNKCSYVQVSS